MANLHWNEENRKYEIAPSDPKFKTLEKEVDDFITKNQHKDMVILTDDDYSLLKKARTNINKKVDEISSKRKQAVGLLVGEFSSNCIAIEKKLSKVSNEMTERLNQYKPVVKSNKVFTIKISSENKNAIDKIIAMAKKYGLNVKEE